MITDAFVIGDIHGHLDRMMSLLADAALVSRNGHWIAGDATLWFVGDFVDRGPKSLEAITTVMRLQREAADHGGHVDSLLGNHDVLFLGAHAFQGIFLINQRRNGGDAKDLERVSDEQLRWLSSRPAMAKLGDTLLMHADSTSYIRYGTTVTQVNRNVATTLEHPDLHRWDDLLHHISERHAFDGLGDAGAGRLVPFLSTFGARRLIHGHTPISYVTGESPETIGKPHVYADGRCVNVDGGMYKGGPGFIYRLTSSTSQAAAR